VRRGKRKGEDLPAFSRGVVKALKGEGGGKIEGTVSSPCFPGAPWAGNKEATRIRARGRGKK